MLVHLDRLLLVVYPSKLHLGVMRVQLLRAFLSCNLEISIESMYFDIMFSTVSYDLYVLLYSLMLFKFFLEYFPFSGIQVPINLVMMSQSLLKELVCHLTVDDLSTMTDF